MNRRYRLLLLVALALAPATLLFTWLRFHRPAPRTAAMPDRTIRIPSSAQAATPAASPTDGSPTASSSSAAWEALTEHRYEDAIRRLRAAGCPEETLRDIIVMQLSRQTFERLLSNSRASIASIPWWRSQNEGTAQFQRETQSARGAMSIEAERLLGKPWRELLSDYFPAYGSLPPDFLSAEHRASLQKLGAEHQERLAAIRARSAGYLDESLKAEFRTARNEYRDAITQLLSPTELADFDARESATSNFVLGHLPEAKSEAEFRAMVRAAQATGIDFEDLLDVDPTDLTAWQKRRSDAVTAIREKFAASTSPERAAELARLEAERDAEEKAAEARRRAEEETRSEAEMLTQISEAARAANANSEGAKAFIEALKARRPEWESRGKEMMSKPGGQAQFEREIRSLMNALATEHLGPNGPEVLKKLPGWKSE